MSQMDLDDKWQNCLENRAFASNGTFLGKAVKTTMVTHTQNLFSAFEGEESSVHPHWQSLPELRLEPATSGLQARKNYLK